MIKFSSSIQTFKVSSNQLTGEIPALSQSMQFLHLDMNRLNGSAPIVTPNLVYLYLGSNLLTGTIPTQLYSMNILSLHTNFLVGSIPLLPNSLTRLQVFNNQLSGCIPPMLTVFYIELYDNPLLQGFLNMTRAATVLIQNTSISEFYHSEPIRLTNCNLNNTALLGKVDGYTQCARYNQFTLDSNCKYPQSATSSSTSYYKLPSTSINVSTGTHGFKSDSILTKSKLSSTQFGIPTKSFATSTLDLPKSSSSVYIRSTNKMTDQAKSMSAQIDQQSKTMLKMTQLHRTSAVSATSSIYLEPKTADVQNIKFTFSLAIHLFINWGLIIYIFNECKRSYSKRTRKTNKILSMSDV